MQNQRFHDLVKLWRLVTGRGKNCSDSQHWGSWTWLQQDRQGFAARARSSPGVAPARGWERTVRRTISAVKSDGAGSVFRPATEVINCEKIWFGEQTAPFLPYTIMRAMTSLIAGDAGRPVRIWMAIGLNPGGVNRVASKFVYTIRAQSRIMRLGRSERFDDVEIECSCHRDLSSFVQDSTSFYVAS